MISIYLSIKEKPIKHNLKLAAAAAMEVALHGPDQAGHHEDNAQLPPKQRDLYFLFRQLKLRNIYQQVHQAE